MQEKGGKPTHLQSLVGELQKAYEQSTSAQRFTANVGDRDIIVTPSYTLEQAVHDAIEVVA